MSFLPINGVVFCNDFRISFFHGIGAIRVCLRREVLVPIFLRLHCRRTIGGFLTPLRVNVRHTCRRTLPGAAKATGGADFNHHCRAVGRVNLVRVSPVAFCCLVGALCTGKVFRRSLFLG